MGKHIACFLRQTHRGADGRQCLSFCRKLESLERLSDWKTNRAGAAVGSMPTPAGQGSDLRGAESVNMAYVVPDHGRLRRRRDAWTKPLFCKTAAAFFRTDPLIDQEEMTL